MATPKKIDNGIGKLTPPPILKLGTAGNWPTNMLHLLNKWLRDLTQKLNGGLSLGNSDNYSIAGNLDAVWVVYYFKVANTEYQIPHSLGRAPVGFVLCASDKSANVYTSNLTAWGTPVDMFLKASAASTTARLLVF